LLPHGFVAIHWHPDFLLVLLDRDAGTFIHDTNMPPTDAKIRAKSKRSPFKMSDGEGLHMPVPQGLLPALGKRRIAEIQPFEILDITRKIENREVIEMAG
jgi:hypothetical protein